MSWNDLAPFAGKKNEVAAVMFRISPDSARFAPSCSIVIDLSAFENELSWLAAGKKVRVQIGADENAGELRLTAGKGFTVGSVGGRSKSIAVRIPVLAGLKTKTKSFVACEYDFTDEWLSLTVPGLRDIEKLPVAAAHAAPGKPSDPNKTVFVSAIAGVKHDMRRGA